MIRVLLEGPILTNSGYGEHTRLVYKSLSEDENVDIFVNPLSWGKTSSWIPRVEDEFHLSVDLNVHKLQMYFESKQKKDICRLIFKYLLESHQNSQKAPYSIVVTAGIETDRVSAEWLLRTHKGIDKLIVPSDHARNGFVKTKYEVQNNKTGDKGTLECSCPVEVVPYPVKNVDFNHLNFQTTTDFNFLCVSLLGPRKNIGKHSKMVYRRI